MNAEDIDKLEVGRDLDALIAEKVMGWKWCASPNTFKPGRPWRRWLAEPYRNMPVWDGVTEMPIDGLFDEESNVLYYSTDIAAAWEVVEKMKQRGFGFWVAGDECWFQHPFAPLNRTSATSTSIPLAICRAALKAISAQEIYGPNSLMQAFGGTPQTVTTEQVNSELDSLSGRMTFTNRQLTELYFNSLTRRGKEILTQQAIDELEAQEQGND
jgi:Phage ABA sandwich domain